MSSVLTTRHPCGARIQRQAGRQAGRQAMIHAYAHTWEQRQKAAERKEDSYEKGKDLKVWQRRGGGGHHSIQAGGQPTKAGLHSDARGFFVHRTKHNRGSDEKRST